MSRDVGVGKFLDPRILGRVGIIMEEFPVSLERTNGIIIQHRQLEVSFIKFKILRRDRNKRTEIFRSESLGVKVRVLTV